MSIKNYQEKTLEYYDNSAKEYFNMSKDVDMSDIYKRFIKHLKTSSRILDFGCGSGRDAKKFIEMGYEVDAIDGSKELCVLASEYLGIEVKHINFLEYKPSIKYDGIWACASLLHLISIELNEVFNNLIESLNDEGILYTSFKYGSYEGIRGDRYYNDFDEEKLEEFLASFKNIKVIDKWISDSAIKERDEKWLNMIIQKD